LRDLKSPLPRASLGLRKARGCEDAERRLARAGRNGEALAHPLLDSRALDRLGSARIFAERCEEAFGGRGDAAAQVHALPGERPPELSPPSATPHGPGSAEGDLAEPGRESLPRVCP